MKKSFLAVLFAATAYMAVTVFVAYHAGGTIDAALKQASSSSPTLRFSPKGSSIGIFSSSYTYTLNFPAQTDWAGAPALTVTFDVAHGPIPFAAGSLSPGAAVVNTRFSLPKNAPETFRASLEQVPELLNTKLRAEAGFGGSLDIQMTVPPLFRDTPLRQEFQGAKVSVLTDTCFSRHTTKVDIPLINLQDESYTFMLKGLSIRSDAVKLRPYVWHGESSMKMAGLALSAKDTAIARSFTLENLVLSGKSVLHTPTIDSSLSLSFVTTVNNSGPLPLFFSSTLYNLDLDGFSQLFGLLQREYGGGGEAVRPYVDEVRKTYDLLLSRIPRVEFEMKALAGSPNEIVLKGEASAPGIKSVPPTPQEALAELRAKADLSAQEQGLAVLVDTFSSQEEKQSQAPQQQLQTALQQLTEKGFFTRDGANIKASAVWDGKALMVNGKLVQ